MVDQVIQQIHAIESQYQHDVSVIQALEGKLETLAAGRLAFDIAVEDLSEAIHFLLSGFALDYYFAPKTAGQLLRL